ncbi:MAG: ABC transporter ATP-binding protein, partial [Candidatus Electrothrix sp. MAN1_4]|nr:ABC transporter ATP-binding protein [Candidatus Electrothrix sp. MAN1_4]
MSDTLVKVEGVSKKFCRSLKKSLWYGMQDLGSELIGQRHGGNGELRPDEFWAVSDVSFELKRGECLGLIGANGAGKSTLLKMLNGLIKPDKGRIEMNGRVGALIELGAGFNPILSGRENIYVNGSVLGFRKKEIDCKLQAIIDFSEIEEFIDSPVQNYSSGMKVRLGFAVAAQMEPDVLMIDEVLAVGDAAFRTKCIQVIAKLAKSSAIIFVSHSMPLIGRMCNKAILMSKGIKSTDTFDVPSNILEYLKLNKSQIAFITGEDIVQIDDIEVHSGGVTTKSTSVEIRQFSNFELSFEVLAKKPLGDYLINLAFFDQEEKNVAETFSIDSGFHVSSG